MKVTSLFLSTHTHLALTSWESLANFLQAALNSGILSNNFVTWSSTATNYNKTKLTWPHNRTMWLSCDLHPWRPLWCTLQFGWRSCSCWRRVSGWSLGHTSSPLSSAPAPTLCSYKKKHGHLKQTEKLSYLCNYYNHQTPSLHNLYMWMSRYNIELYRQLVFKHRSFELHV